MIPIPYLTKPQFGEACNGCGLCCALSLCELGIHVFAKERAIADFVKGPCPALEYESGRTWCGLLRHPTKYLDAGKSEDWKDAVLSELIENLLPIGQGCGLEDL